MAEIVRVEERAERVIAFIERLQITIGDKSGPFVLRDWQKQFIRDIYAPHRGGRRVVRRAVFSVGRKNGKTEIAAAIALAHLIGPEAEKFGQIYSAANDRKQAAILFDAMKRMISTTPALQRHLRVVDSTKTITVMTSGVRGEGSYYRALAADGGRQHGLNPSLIIYDELAQSKSRELLDTLTSSQGARHEPLFIAISTQNNDPTHPLSEMIDDALRGEDPTVVCHLYAADDDCDILDEDQWVRANPALGDFRDIEEFRSMAHRAARLPSEEAAFRLLYLNQRVSLHGSLISPTDWKACRGDFEYVEKEPIILGLDMSRTTDLTALISVSVNNGSRVKSWYWKPAAMLSDHTRKDGVRYDLYAKQGLLETSPGRTINPRQVAQKIIDLCQSYDVRALAFDKAMMGEVLRYFDDVGFEAQQGEGYGLRLEPIQQGYISFSPMVRAFENSVLEGELVHDGHPLTTFCVMNAQVITDAADNRKLDKSASRFRIDGAVSLAMALGVKALDRTPTAPVSPWEDPAFSIRG